MKIVVHLALTEVAQLVADHVHIMTNYEAKAGDVVPIFEGRFDEQELTGFSVTLIPFGPHPEPPR